MVTARFVGNKILLNSFFIFTRIRYETMNISARDPEHGRTCAISRGIILTWNSLRLVSSYQQLVDVFRLSLFAEEGGRGREFDSVLRVCEYVPMQIFNVITSLGLSYILGDKLL